MTITNEKVTKQIQMEETKQKDETTKNMCDSDVTSIGKQTP